MAEQLADLPPHCLARVLAAVRQLEDEEGVRKTRTGEVCRLWRDLTYQAMGRLTLKFDGELADSFLEFDCTPMPAAAERLFARCAPWLASLSITLSAGGLAAAGEHAAALAIVRGAASAGAPALRALSLQCQTWGNGGALFESALACTQLARLHLPFCPLPEHPPPAPAVAAAAWQQWLGRLGAWPRLQELTLLDCVAPFCHSEQAAHSSAAPGPSVADLAATLAALSSLTRLELRRVEEASLDQLPAALHRLPTLRLLAIHLGEGLSPSRTHLSALAALEGVGGGVLELQLVCHPTRTIPAHWEPLSRLRCLRRLEAQRWLHCDDPVPPAVWQTASLTALVLSGAKLAEVPPTLALPALRGLTLLYLTPTPDGQLPQQLVHLLPGLTALSLWRAPGDRDPPLRLPGGMAGALPGLLELDLCGCSLQAPPPQLAGLRTLRTLRLRRNTLRDVPPGSLPPGLRHLDLTGNPLSRLPPAILADATTLTQLDLSECRLDAQAVGAAQRDARSALPLLRVLRTAGQQPPPSLAELGRRAPGAMADALLLPARAAGAAAGAVLGLGDAVFRAVTGRRMN